MAIREAGPKQIRKRFSVVLELREVSAITSDDMSLTKQQIMVFRGGGRLTYSSHDLLEALRTNAYRARLKVTQAGQLHVGRDGVCAYQITSVSVSDSSVA